MCIRDRLRLAPASEHRVGTQGISLQKVAGSSDRADITQSKTDVLALPAKMSVFADHSLNHGPYILLANQYTCFDQPTDWIADNCRATQLAPAQFPGVHSR